MKKIMKMIKNQKGLTLVELLAVIVILAIIVAIAIPVIGNIISSSDEKAEVSEALNIIAAAKLAHTSGDLDCAENECTKEKLSEYVDRAGVYKTVTFDKDNNRWTITGHEGIADISALGGKTAETDLLEFLK